MFTHYNPITILFVFICVHSWKDTLRKYAFIIYPDDLGQTKKNPNIQFRNCLPILSIGNQSNIAPFSAKV